MKLICPECRHENEIERIYCHDCGARLDRSKVAKTEAKAEDPKETQRRLRALMDARGAESRLLQSATFLVGAVAVAVLVQLLRPADLPEKPKGPSELPSQINLELEDAATSPPGRPALTYTEEQVNAYLQNRLRSERKTLSNYLQFERAAVRLDEGSARATVERSLFGISVYITAIFSPQVEGGKVVGHLAGGKIGHMPIHPELMKYSDFAFKDVLGALDREIKSIAKLGGIELHPQMVVIKPKPGATVPVPAPVLTPTPAAAIPPPVPAASPTP